jgi:SAM-dependent methyltransferase
MWCCPNCRLEADFRDERRPWPSDWVCPACRFCTTYREGLACLAPEIIEAAGTYDPELFGELIRFEESNFWFVNRARFITGLIRKHFPRAGNFLEIGCGTGSILLALRKALPKLNLTGSDPYPHGLAFARRRLGGSVTLVQMDARLIPARSEFDVIGAFDVVEHIREDEDVLAEIRNALKPGGGTIISVPQHPWLWSPADDAACHQRRYARGELERKLERAGLRVLWSTSFNALLLPLMMASRTIMNLRAYRHARPDPWAEFRIAPWLNRALSSVLRLELSLTAAGIRWPLGGSRFVVAHRPLTRIDPAICADGDLQYKAAYSCL